IRGEIGSAARLPPVVDIKETDHSTAFTAFESWIPAGRIDRFIWSWVEHSSPYTAWGVEKTFTDEHRFIFPKPAAATQLSQICLRIEGTQTLPGGQEVSVAGGTTCSPSVVGVEMDVPVWFGPITLPIWRPGVADDAVLRNVIAAHASLQAGVPGKEPWAGKVVVYFADWKRDKPLDSLNAALARAKKTSTLTVIVVLPAGAFDRSRREIESKLPAQGERRALVQFTEDDEGGWTKMFAVAKLPSAYLVNAKRQFVWKHEGGPNPAELAAAIDQHQVPTSEPRFRPLRLQLSRGDPPPDISFKTDAGEEFVLHRFIRREVLLNFWQSWSAPCLAELSRLQRLHEGRGKAPFIVAFHGGNNRDAIKEIRKRLGLTFPMVQDSQQQIAQQFGVRCWPTTVLIGVDGRTEQIQFGVAHEHATPSSRSHRLIGNEIMAKGLVAFVLLAGLAAAGAAQAQSYPTRTITLTVTAAAGGVTDVVARALGQRLAEAWGQQVVIENKGGAAHVVGAQSVAKATPDGYSLLVAEAGTFTINPTLYAKGKLPYDAEEDFIPITGIVRINQALLGRVSLPAGRVRGLIALAKTKPGEPPYGAAGVGSAPHMNMLLFASMAGVKLEAVHYRGAAPALTDVIAGHVDLMSVSVSLALPPFRAGQIKIFGIGRSKRLAP